MKKLISNYILILILTIGFISCEEYEDPTTNINVEITSVGLFSNGEGQVNTHIPIAYRITGSYDFFIEVDLGDGRRIKGGETYTTAHYQNPGTYKIIVWVEDYNGNSAHASTQLVVKNGF